MKKQMLSPYAAENLQEVCQLKQDNETAGDFWILTDGLNVTLCAQKDGEAVKGSVTIPHAEFNRLVTWYMAEQQIRENEK